MVFLSFLFFLVFFWSFFLSFLGVLERGSVLWGVGFVFFLQVF